MNAEICLSDHIGLVHHLAGHICRRYNVRISQAYEDLVGAGMVALAESREHFYARGNAAFSTYAFHRINGAMIDYLNREGRYVKMHKNPIPTRHFSYSIGYQVEAREQLRLLNETVEKLPYRRKMVIESVLSLTSLEEAAKSVVIELRRAKKWRREFLMEWNWILETA